jgi:hypothetical protein
VIEQLGSEITQQVSGWFKVILRDSSWIEKALEMQKGLVKEEVMSVELSL